MAAQPPPDTAGSTRHKKRARQRIDCRSSIGRRVRRLVTIFIAELGGRDAVSELQLMHVCTAAELKALSEDSRARALRGEITDIAAVAKLEGHASRALRLLKLDGQHKLTPGSRSALSSYLADKAADRVKLSEPTDRPGQAHALAVVHQPGAAGSST